jgi:hypothetical protein
MFPCCRTVKILEGTTHNMFVRAYVTRIEGASLGGGKTSSCCFEVEENFLFPREEL